MQGQGYPGRSPDAFRGPINGFPAFLKLGHLFGILFTGMAGLSQLHRQQEEISSFGVV